MSAFVKQRKNTGDHSYMQIHVQLVRLKLILNMILI